MRNIKWYIHNKQNHVKLIYRDMGLKGKWKIKNSHVLLVVFFFL